MNNVVSSLSLINIHSLDQWIETIINEDDLCLILRDKRGSHKHVTFYDDCPELEAEAKAFALQKASSKDRLAELTQKKFS